ncbi:hypothetical protein MTP03_32130 [Tsukamurella sp. PLM1]|nr:hypothetical protein MTP03_32130 [Tsukamurella sp. PLM1]
MLGVPVGGVRRCVRERVCVSCQGPMTSASRTMSQPVEVCHVVSSMRLPGRYRRSTGTSTPYGARRNDPAPRSRIAPNTLGESGRGMHIHSTVPSRAIRHVFSQSERNA